MMRLPRFQYFAPRELGEALAILDEWGPQAQVVAGGTDLWPNMKRRQQTPTRVIGLRGIAPLHQLAGDAKSGFTVGAMASLTRVERHGALAEAWPALAAAIRTVSTPPLRNMGTVGGNLCLDTRCNYYDQNWEWRKAIDFCIKREGGVCWVAPGSPRCWAVSSTDLAPALIALGAEVKLVSREGWRLLPVAELYQDDGIAYLAKRPDEIVTEVRLGPPAGWRSTYWKLRRREAFDFPVLSLAAAVQLAPDGTVLAARMAFGAVASRPVVSPAADGLVGAPLTDEAIERAADDAARVAKPLDNTDFSLGWRKRVARAYVVGALRELRGDDPATLGPLARRAGSLPLVS